MNKINTAKIREKLKGVTPYPWDNRCKEQMNNMAKPRYVWSEHGWLAEVFSPLDSAVVDAEFIAESPQLVSDLCDTIDKLRATLEFYGSGWGTAFGYDDLTNERIQKVLTLKGKLAREVLKECFDEGI